MRSILSSGCRAKNAGSNGTMRRTPYSGGKATRSNPKRRSAPRAALSASSIASKASRARASNASPASVAETCRVVRMRSLTSRRRSSAAIERETEGWEMPNSRAALEKLPLSTVRTNKASCCRRSFIQKMNILYLPRRNTCRHAHCLAQAHQSLPRPIAADGQKFMRSRAMGELSGKVAIVTGASKGIGAAIARRFAEAGAAVAVNYASDKAGANRLVEEIKRGGGKAVAIQANVSKSADVKRLFAETKAKLGAPSILVNNAGVFTFGPLESVTEEEFHRQFDTNVLGTLLATQEAVATFDGAGGSVINLSTIASVNPVPNSVIYSSSKAAVDTMTRALALELAPRKIRVNAIAPGATETEGTKTMGLTMETAKAMGMVMPMGRMGQPDDIARVALFLASDQSSWLTGDRISRPGEQR